MLVDSFLYIGGKYIKFYVVVYFNDVGLLFIIIVWWYVKGLCYIEFFYEGY